MNTSVYFNLGGPEIVHETIDGETVIVNLENGNYYSLRNVGVDVWNMIESSATLEDITNALTLRYAGEPGELVVLSRRLCWS